MASVDAGLPVWLPAVSADGSAAIGIDPSGEGFRWTPDAGIIQLGPVPPHDSFATPMLISSDGSVVVGRTCWPTDGWFGACGVFRWTSETGPILLDLDVELAIPRAMTLGGGTIVGGQWTWGSYAAWIWKDGVVTNMGQGSVDAISWDGAAATGYLGNQAFRWTSGGGVEMLGTLPGHPSCGGHSINADGNLIAGSCWSPATRTYRAFRWTADDGIVDIGTIDGFSNSYAQFVSQFGSVITGSSWNNGSDSHVFRWTPEGGMVALESLPGSTSTWLNDATTDGTTVVGTAVMGNATSAYLWRQGLGAVDLNEYLPSLGIDLAGWTLTEATGVAAPFGTVGPRTIVGNGINPKGEAEAWIATLPAVQIPCDGNADCPANMFCYFEGVGCNAPIGVCSDDYPICVDVNFVCGCDGVWYTDICKAMINGIPVGPKGVCTGGDLNGDGSTGVADLLILLAAWGPCVYPQFCIADLNGDDVVGVPDLLILLANWS